jgi:hypothetical protein
MSESKEQVELRKAQAVFMKELNDFLVNGPLKLAPDGANQVTRAMLVNTMRSVQGQNLEALDELARDYLVEKQ